MFLPDQPNVSRSSLVSAAFARLVHAGKRLLADISNNSRDSRHYDEVRELLATVPLSTGEYAVAILRLQNAMRYACRGQKGAALYELIMLVRNLAKRQQICEA
jgi:hypothetical protein